MKEKIIYYRNKFTHGFYIHILKPIFFDNNPEFIHDHMTKVGVTLGRYSLGRKIVKSFLGYENPILVQNILCIDFKNPIGLSAGFDKNAELTDILPSVGFGFAEVGSITGNRCDGNPRPRLWRLPKSNGLVVYYGLKNDGCEIIYERLKNKKFDIPIGVSVAMTNCKENLNLKNAIRDYAKAFKIMEPLSKYMTVNISCPNTEGGQPFIVPYKFDYLFDILDEIPTNKPIFIKLSPDLAEKELDNLIKTARMHRIHGIICTNLTKNRDNPKIIESNVPKVGGLSGKIVQELSDKMLAYIYKKEGNRFILVGSGGIFTAEDAYKKN